MSSKSVWQECQVRTVLQECLTRVSSKSVSPERCAIASSKGVLQECHLSVWTQGVSQVSLLEMWQISIVSVCQHTCRHSGSWASSCFFPGQCPPLVTWEGGFSTRSTLQDLQYFMGNHYDTITWQSKIFRKIHLRCNSFGSDSTAIPSMYKIFTGKASELDACIRKKPDENSIEVHIDLLNVGPRLS